jgi:hypothetical protein
MQSDMGSDQPSSDITESSKKVFLNLSLNAQLRPGRESHRGACVQRNANVFSDRHQHLRVLILLICMGVIFIKTLVKKIRGSENPSQ